MLRSTIAVLTAFFALAGASDASADTGCPSQPRAQAFARFLDPFQYVLAPGGDFEADDHGWSLDGAAVGAGNEPFFLAGADDARSLALPASAIATSPATCVTLEHPTVRFVARSTGSPLGLLAVSAIVRDGQGLLSDLPIGVVTGLGSAWRPSLPMLLAPSLVDAVGRDHSEVRLRFTAIGLGAAFRIDDVFVDPYGRD
jgi:hypothetical protein